MTWKVLPLWHIHFLSRLKLPSKKSKKKKYAFAKQSDVDLCQPTLADHICIFFLMHVFRPMFCADLGFHLFALHEYLSKGFSKLLQHQNGKFMVTGNVWLFFLSMKEIYIWQYEAIAST